MGTRALYPESARMLASYRPTGYNRRVNIHALRGLTTALLALLLAACAAPPSAAPTPVPSPTSAPAAIATAAPTATPGATPTPAATATPVPVVVTSTLNLTYSVPITAPVDSYALDVYAPVGGKGLPVVIFLPGTAETKKGYAHMAQTVAAAGFVFYAADWPIYTLSRATQENGRGYREVVEIVACAVRYARATAAAYGGDASKVTLGGFSAGAAGAALMAFQDDRPEAAWDALMAKAGGPPPQARCAQQADSAHVDALLGASGPYNISTPPRGVDAAIADMVMIAPHLAARRGLRVRLTHGNADSLVPVAASVQFDEALRAAGYDVKLTRFDGPHAAPEALMLAQLRELWGK